MSSENERQVYELSQARVNVTGAHTVPAEAGTGKATQRFDQLHFTERVRMIDHDHMLIDYTVEDPVALTKPIHASPISTAWSRKPTAKKTNATPWSTADSRP